jgi:hypothetical protein
MYNFDIIKKLENIKHNYLIYALEKYTDQITADDLKKRELERQKQDELTKQEVKKPTDEVKKPTDEVKKPTDEVKKPTDEVKKFENNIMDSLKWVFISIGILIFLIFVGTLIYWGLYGSGNYDEDNIRPIEKQYIEPTNQTNRINQYIEPTNQTSKINQYIEPTNQTNRINQYIEPTNVEEKEGSIFSFLSPFSKKENISDVEAISKTKAQLEAEEYLKSIKKSNTKQQLDNIDEPATEIKTKAQLEAEEYLKSIKKSNTKQQLDNINEPATEIKSKAQLEAEEYLESIKKSITKQQLDTKNINEDDDLPKLLSSNIKNDNNIKIQKE